MKLRSAWLSFAAASVTLVAAVNGMGNIILHRPTPALVVTFDPPMPVVGAAASPGTLISTVRVVWTNGAPFTGTIAFTTPYGDDDGVFALSGNDIIVNPDGPGTGSDGGTTQLISVLATQ